MTLLPLALNLRKLIPALLLLPLACTCGRAKPTEAPLRVTGTVRYMEDQQSLQSTLQLSDTTLAQPPSLLGQPLNPMPRLGKGYYRTRRQLHYPAQLPYRIPGPDGARDLTYSMQPVYVDSLPASVNKRMDVHVRISDVPLADGETLIFFLEPKPRGTPRKLSLLGPTQSGVIMLPSAALVDIPVGGYDLYLIKLLLVRDSTAAFVNSMQLEYVTRMRSVTITE